MTVRPQAEKQKPTQRRQEYTFRAFSQDGAFLLAQISTHVDFGRPIPPELLDKIAMAVVNDVDPAAFEYVWFSRFTMLGLKGEDGPNGDRAILYDEDLQTAVLNRLSPNKCMHVRDFYAVRPA